jgi:hypothetical protein
MESNGKKKEGKDLPTKEEQLEDTLRRFNFLAALRERKQIRRVCVDSLRIYRQIEAEMPQSSKMERYLQVVERRSSTDPRAVLKITRFVREGFAQSPAERQLNFRDLVQYIAVTDCPTAEVAGAEPRARNVDFVADIVSEIIPANL